MPYNDAEYLRALEQLDNAVATLIENEISPEDIRKAVESAIENNEGL